VRALAFGIGPSDDDKFFPVQALGLEPQAAVVGDIGCIGGLRDDPLQPELARLGIERLPTTDLVVAVLERRAYATQQGREPRFSVDQRRAGQILPVDMKQIEDEEYQGFRAAGLRGGLDHAEGGGSIRSHTAQLAVQIGLSGGQRLQRFRHPRELLRPVQASTRQQPHVTALEPRVHAIPIELDLVQPVRPIGRRLDQLRQLRLDPARQCSLGRSRFSSARARSRGRHHSAPITISQASPVTFVRSVARVEIGGRWRNSMNLETCSKRRVWWLRSSRATFRFAASTAEQSSELD
jgi:hypothetical protein